MAKDKMQFYEEMVFDNVQYAVDIVNAYKKKKERSLNGLLLSIFYILYGVMLYAIFGESLSNLSGAKLYIFGIPLLALLIASYALGGGLRSAIGNAWKIAKFGWLILPFPIDIITGVSCMYAAGCLFVAFPPAFVYMSYRQINMDYKAAKKYLSYYKVKQPKEQNVQSQIDVKQHYEQDYYTSNSRYQSRNSLSTGSGYNRTGLNTARGERYGSTARSQLNSGAGYSRTGTGSGYGRTASNAETGRTYGSTTRSQAGSNTRYRQSGTSSGYSRTSGYSGTRNYR